MSSEPIPMRETIDDTQLVFEILTATDTTPPTEVVERLTELANKWRYEFIGISADGVIQSCEYDEDGQPVGCDPFGRPLEALIVQDGLVAHPWSPELIERMRKTYERYSIRDLLGGL